MKIYRQGIVIDDEAQVQRQVVNAQAPVAPAFQQAVREAMLKDPTISVAGEQTRQILDNPAPIPLVDNSETTSTGPVPHAVNDKPEVQE